MYYIIKTVCRKSSYTYVAGKYFCTSTPVENFLHLWENLLYVHVHKVQFIFVLRKHKFFILKISGISGGSLFLHALHILCKPK